MDDPTRRRSGGRAARQALRLAAHAEHIPFLTRKLAPFEVLGEEGLALIEHNADVILEEVGVEFRGDPDALRYPRGRRRHRRPSASDSRADVPVIVQAALCQFTSTPGTRHATSRIGGTAHGLRAELRLAVRPRSRRRPPLRDARRLPELREARRMLAVPASLGAAPCAEPVDLPVNKRHLEMVYAHMRFSDKPFMGSVTAPERARDTVEMARLTFGADYLEDHTVILSLINANSPLVWDATMLGAARAYAEANQATLLTPFILAGAMAPVTAAGVRPDPRRGARRDGVRPARPARRARRLRLVRVVDVDAVGRADVRDARAGPRALRDGGARPAARRPVPLRRQPVCLEDRRRPGRLRVGEHDAADGPRGGQLRPPRGRLARGRPRDRVREVHPRRRSVRDGGRVRQGRGPVGERPGARRHPGQRTRASTSSAPPTRWPTSRPRSTAPRSPTTTASSSGRRTARSTRPSGPTRSGSGCWPSTRRRRSTRASTRPCSSSWRSARRRCRTRRSDGGAPRPAWSRSSGRARARRHRAGRWRSGRSLLTRSSSSSRSRISATRSPICRRAWVSVTASPAKGIDATLDWAGRLQADGFRAILISSGHDDRGPGRAGRPAGARPRGGADPAPSSSVAMPTSPGSTSTGSRSSAR